MPDAILEFKNISKQFFGNEIFRSLNLSIKQNEIHALAGKNGSGKTLLMNFLYGLAQPDSGEIIFRGKPVSFKNPAQAKKAGIHMVQYRSSLYPDLDVAANLFITRGAGMCRKINQKKIHLDAFRLFNAVHLKIDTHTKAKDLSDSEKKIIEFMKIYLACPAVALFDEPTQILDRQMIRIFSRLIKGLKRRGTTVIYATNRLDEILRICDRVSLIAQKNVFATYSTKEIDLSHLASGLFGNMTSIAYPKIHLPKGSSLLQVKNLCVPDLLQNINFTIHQKEIVGLICASSDPSSTLAQAIYGSIYSDKKIFICGKQVTIRTPADAVKHGINFISSGISDMNLYLNENIGYNISIGNLETSKSNGTISEQRIDSLSCKYIRKIGIKVYDRRQRISYLSSGNQQKVEIAKVLNTYAKIVIMDHASTGLDFAGRVDLYNIMNGLLLNGAGILFISSDLPEILGICDRVLILRDKTIVAQRNCKNTTMAALLKDLSEPIDS